MSEVMINQKFIHTSPRKLRLVADSVRKLKPVRALSILQFTPKAAASELEQAIKSALAAAKQKDLNEENILFKRIEVNEGPKLKRYRAGTRGRPKSYKKRMSHIKIVLTDELTIKNDKLTTNKEKKEETQNKNAKK